MFFSFSFCVPIDYSFSFCAPIDLLVFELIFILRSSLLNSYMYRYTSLFDVETPGHYFCIQCPSQIGHYAREDTIQERALFKRSNFSVLPPPTESNAAVALSFPTYFTQRTSKSSRQQLITISSERTGTGPLIAYASKRVQCPTLLGQTCNLASQTVSS